VTRLRTHRVSLDRRNRSSDRPPMPGAGPNAEHFARGRGALRKLTPFGDGHNVAIGIVGSRVVDRAQSLIVIALLAVFAVFIAVTLVDIDFDLLAFSGYPSAAESSPASRSRSSLTSASV
jgi:hypothetical protein